MPGDVTALAPRLAKVLDCYEHQCSDRPEWETCRARELVEQMRRESIQRMPGYDATPWGVDSRDALIAADRRVIVIALDTAPGTVAPGAN